MLEKAKNRKIFYFFLLIILGFSLFIFPVSAILFDSFEVYGNNAVSIGDASYYQINKLRVNVTEYPDLYEIEQTSDIATNGKYAKFLIEGNLTYATFSIYHAGFKIGEGYVNLDTWLSKGYMHAVFTITKLDFGTLTGVQNFDVTSSPQLRYYNTDMAYNTTTTDTPFFCHYYPSSYRIGMGSYDITYDYSEPEINPLDITVSPSSGETPLTVTFTDNSTGIDTSYPYPTYIIYFGDGETFSGDYQYSGEVWTHEYNTELSSKTFNVTYVLSYYNGTSYSISKIITATSNTDNFYVHVAGLNTSAISGANVSIWYNGAYQDSEGTSVLGKAYFTIPYNRLVNGTVTKPGYKNATFTQYVGTTDIWKVVTLYLEEEEEGSGDSYGNYIVSFKNANTGEEIGYSNIEVYSNSGYTALFYDEYSNSDGIWTGLIPMDVTYYYKYPETIGYYSQSWSYNLTSSPSYKIVNLVPKSGATSTVTPTPTATTTTITPTVTYTYNDSNLSTLNVKERMTNLLVLVGFQNAESADLIFAMIIVLGCTALMGWITLSGSGAGIGAIIGFVFSLGLGLLPIWLLIAAVFLGGIYLALKLFGGTGE